MQFRRSTALGMGALLLAVPFLSSCARGYATDVINTTTTGVNNRDGDVDVLGTVVVSKQPLQGTLIATFVNNTNEPLSVTKLAAAGIGSTLAFADFPAIEVPARGIVNLADTGGIGVSGDFVAGDFVELGVDTNDGRTVTLNVLVVPDDGYYAGLDTAQPPTDSPT